MTVIAVRDGWMVSDSRITIDTEAGGVRYFHCEKLYKVRDAVIGVCGDGFAALRFVEWFRRGKKGPNHNRRDDLLIHGEADFGALVLYKDGTLFEYDRWLTPDEIKLQRGESYASGSGAKAALGAMYAGADAATAVEIACQIDPFCSLPIVKVHVSEL